MGTWAVIKTGGKQYKVEEGQTLAIEKLDGEKDSKVSFAEVLMIGGDKIQVGLPAVAKASVQGKIIETFKDTKIRVVKFKSKSRYTRTSGHRHLKTKVLIEKISA